MSTNPECTVFIGNLDERVPDRVLYDILIQAGRLVDLYIPRDRETDKPKGFAFAEYETEEVADYAVKLFSGLVTLYNRTLRFAISGQDKPSSNVGTPASNSAFKSRFNSPHFNGVDVSSPNHRMLSSSSRLFQDQQNHERVPPFNHSNGFQESNNYDYRRGSGSGSSIRSRPTTHYYDYNSGSTTGGYGRH